MLGVIISTWAREWERQILRICIFHIHFGVGAPFSCDWSTNGEKNDGGSCVLAAERYNKPTKYSLYLTEAKSSSSNINRKILFRSVFICSVGKSRPEVTSTAHNTQNSNNCHLPMKRDMKLKVSQKQNNVKTYVWYVPRSSCLMHINFLALVTWKTCFILAFKCNLHILLESRTTFTSRYFFHTFHSLQFRA